MKENNLDLNLVQLNWSLDILKRINEIVESNQLAEEKIKSIKWLTKQALKIEREE